MITVATLRERSSKDLAQMAKDQGVAGWHSMRKEQLIRVLIQVAKKKPRKTLSPGQPVTIVRQDAPPPVKLDDRAKSNTDPKVLDKIRLEHQQRELFRDLAVHSTETKKRTASRDRVVLLVRDAYWLHVYWEITRGTVQRAQVALADKWHGAQPMLRIVRMDDDGSANAIENIYRDIPIHGGVNNWYIDVSDPPSVFRAVLGYKMIDGRFHQISKSNTVTTPLPNGQTAFDAHWSDVAKDYERVFSLSGGNNHESNPKDLREVFEEKLRRPMNEPMFARFGNGINVDKEGFPFDVDAEMIVYGLTDPKAVLNIAGEPVKVRNDGSFAVSFAMPDRRQVIPIVASSRDGSKQRTTVLAVERNTKVMEPINCDSDD